MSMRDRRKKKRNYKKEYREYHGKPEQIDNRSKRNSARRKMKLKKGDGKEVDHKRPLSKGGGNGKGNLRVVSRSANRKKGSAY
jgi:ribosomal protein S17